jgi:hypothetical protein
MQDNRELMGHPVAVVAMSRHQTQYVPLGEASLFCLYPDPIRRRGHTVVRYRLARMRLSLDEHGKLVSHCLKWWDTDALSAAYKKQVRGLGGAHHALVTLQNALQRDLRAPFGVDLPIYVDSSTSRSGPLDWDMLEYDVMRGLNGMVPFDYKLSRRMRPRILPEIPFLDLEDHFRSVIPNNTIMTLIRDLLREHTENEHGMTLVPARWLSHIVSHDAVVVVADVPSVLHFSNPAALDVEAGSFRVSLRPPVRLSGARQQRGRSSATV